MGIDKVWKPPDWKVNAIGLRISLSKRPLAWAITLVQIQVKPSRHWNMYWLNCRNIWLFQKINFSAVGPTVGPTVGPEYWKKRARHPGPALSCKFVRTWWETNVNFFEDIETILSRDSWNFFLRWESYHILPPLYLFFGKTVQFFCIWRTKEVVCRNSDSTPWASSNTDVKINVKSVFWETGA